MIHWNKRSYEKNYQIEFQMDPPHMHSQNFAERSIWTCKKHFIAGFSTTDPNVPIKKWDRLISQCVITLYLLQNSRVNPALSEYVDLFGPYDFNKSPMVPPGTRVIVHDKPIIHTSWGHNVTLGWYIGHSLYHYRWVDSLRRVSEVLNMCGGVEFNGCEGRIHK